MLDALVMKFPIDRPKPAIVKQVEPQKYFDVLGRQAGILALQDGTLQVWVYPTRLVSDFKLSFQVEGDTNVLDASAFAERLEVTPSYSAITYAHDQFRVTEYFIVPRDQPGALILLDVATSKPLTIGVKFVPDMKLMWPGALGGVYAYWDDDVKGFVLGEGRGKYYGIIGSPAAASPSNPPAHALPDSPNTFKITISPDDARHGYIPIVFSGSVDGFDKAKSAYDAILKDPKKWLDVNVAADDAFLNDQTVGVETPDPLVNEAFAWQKIALARGLVCNPQLGCGLVAGYGLSGRGGRPGFAWFFGGDASINSLAFLSFGDYDTVRTALDFMIKYQRADGKIAHEVSQSAATIPWFTEYGYPYYHGDTTAYFLYAVAEYYRFSGDAEYLKKNRDAIQKAYAYCVSTDSDGDGLMENTKAGLAAIEEGPLRQRVLVDSYLAGVWIQAMQEMAPLFEQFGDPSAVAANQDRLKKARDSYYHRFFFTPGTNAKRDYPYFAVFAPEDIKPGGAAGIEEITVWPGFNLAWNQIPAADAGPILSKLASEDISTDWGTHMLAKSSGLYDPTRYNGGAVWPFLTGFAAWGQYNYHRPYAGYVLVRALAKAIHVNAPGVMDEVWSGDYDLPLVTSVPHQLFSSSSFVTPLLRGTLGLESDAPSRTLTFAPHLPPEWDSVLISNVKVGPSKVQLKLTRSAGTIRLEATQDQDQPVHVVFSPALGAGARVKAVRADGKAPKWRLEDTGLDVHPTVEFTLGAREAVEVQYDPGVELGTPDNPTRVGDGTRSLKILDARVEANRLTLQVEGLSGVSYAYRVYLPQEAKRADGATPGAYSAGAQEMTISFPAADPPAYRPATIVLEW